MNIEVEKVFTERGFTNIEQMATMFDWYKEEVDRLNNNINKAIEYIEENYTQYGEEDDFWSYRLINADNTLDILKGVDK